jgi:hypothetical protein
MEERLNAKFAAAREERKRVSSEWSVEYARKEAPYLAAVRETNRLARERCAQDRCDQERRAQERRDQQRHDQERRERYDQERRGYQERHDERERRAEWDDGAELRDASALLDANGITDKASLNRWRRAGNHPDKVPPHEQDSAHVRFQEVSNAWNTVDAHRRAHFFGE